MTIQVTIKNVYGEQKVYPACDKSKAFAMIAGHRTLTDFTISQIKALGFTIKVVPVTL